MKRTLKIDIECEQDTCGECEYSNYIKYCTTFFQFLQVTTDNNNSLRCDACKNAEVKNEFFM